MNREGPRPLPMNVEPVATHSPADYDAAHALLNRLGMGDHREGRWIEIAAGAFAARVQMAEASAAQWREGAGRWQGKAERAEALLGYAREFGLGDAVLVRLPDLSVREAVVWAWWAKDAATAEVVVHGPGWRGGFPDLDSALRALSDAGLLPDDVKVSE